jgi:hypothetical protein
MLKEEASLHGEIDDKGRIFSCAISAIFLAVAFLRSKLHALFSMD